MFPFPSNDFSLYIFVFLYEKGISRKYPLFLALKDEQNKQVEKELRYSQVLCYSFFLLTELVFALRDVSLQSPMPFSKFELFEENKWVFFAFASYTKVMTNSVNRCVLSFEKGLEMKILDAFLM